MKRKWFIATLALTLFGLTAVAQKVPRPMLVKSRVPDLENVKTALEAMGIEMFSFDWSDLVNEPRKMVIYVDEYKDSTVTEYLTIPIKRNMRYVDDYRPEQQAQVREKYKLSKNEHIAYRYDRLDIYMMPDRTKDSVMKVKFDIKNYGSMQREFKLRPVVAPNYSTYFYTVRPFQLTEVKDGQKTPLILYGSGWFDPDANVVRMCGESEIDPEMSSDILKKLPHYYVIGIRTEKTDD